MEDQPYLTAQEAADALGISLTSLYAYVSRGLIHSEPLNQGKRTKRYRAEDVQKLKERQEQRRNPTKAVAGALHWGAPLLESALTLIADNQFYYRGYDALHLAQNHSVEQVAALIWTGTLPNEAPALFAEAGGRLPARCLALQPHLVGVPAIESFQALLPLAAGEDLTAYDFRPAAVAQTGAHILRMLTAIATGQADAMAGVAETLQRQWAPQAPAALGLIRQALILCADHELNVSSFTARCVASARATPYQVVLAGLAALQGVRHGRVSERVEVFLREVGHPAQAKAAVLGRLKRGETIPGFGHPLYPAGDPRGRVLLATAAAAYPDSAAVALATAINDTMREVRQEHPTIDFGLVTLAQVLGLPPQGPITLFALGRTIGWIGHAIEQYGLEPIIRPRAHYTGPPIRPK
jgi:citrate synthase